MWKSIKGYEGIYEVSDSGQIRALDRFVVEISGKKRFRAGRIITKKKPKGESYYRVNLYKNRKQKRLPITSVRN